MKHINIKKILYIALVIILFAFNLIYCCNAAVIVDPNYSISEEPLPSEINNGAGVVLAAVRIFGTVASVLILAVIGIQYMTSSPEGKADYKKNMYPYIVGAVLLFMGTWIVQFIYDAIH